MFYSLQFFIPCGDICAVTIVKLIFSVLFRVVVLFNMPHTLFRSLACISSFQGVASCFKMVFLTTFIAVFAPSWIEFILEWVFCCAEYTVFVFFTRIMNVYFVHCSFSFDVMLQSFSMIYSSFTCSADFNASSQVQLALFQQFFTSIISLYS